MLRPIEPLRPVEEPPPEGAEPPQARNARLSRNQRQEDLFYKDHAIFSQNERKWDKAKEVEAKLRERILSTQNIQTEYQKLMGVALLDWPSGGPTNWLAKWEKLINQATRYDEPLLSWLRDICLVWQRVSDLAVLLSNVKDKMEENDAARYTPALASSKIQYYWELKKQGSALRDTNKPKATRSAFAATATLNGEEADTPATSE
ncbi:hypothetical protein MMC29_004900 [Sticta canariensis]|nr:hypothetical protein [Sticta canariensis]